MIDTRRTLVKLHQKFPNLTLDNLFEILDCYTNCVMQYDDTGKPIMDSFITTNLYGDSITSTTTSGEKIATSNPIC